MENLNSYGQQQQQAFFQLHGISMSINIADPNYWYWDECEDMLRKYPSSYKEMSNSLLENYMRQDGYVKSVYVSLIASFLSISGE